jgi:hypothetical protein
VKPETIRTIQIWTSVACAIGMVLNLLAYAWTDTPHAASLSAGILCGFCMLLNKP